MRCSGQSVEAAHFRPVYVAVPPVLFRTSAVLVVQEGPFQNILARN